MNKLVIIPLGILTIVGVVFAQAQRPKPVVKPSIERAVWNSGWNFLGITETDFRTLGFDTQTKEQANRIFGFLITNRPTFSCEKYYKDKEELKRVHVFVEAGSASSTDVGGQEFVGRLRSRLSSIHDVSLVYSDSDADIIVKALVFPNKNQFGQEMGYTASVVVLTPCAFKSVSGYDKGETTVRQLADHEVFADSSEEAVLTRVSSTIDVNDLDNVRKEHAASLKLRTDEPKP